MVRDIGESDQFLVFGLYMTLWWGTIAWFFWKRNKYERAAFKFFTAYNYLRIPLVMWVSLKYADDKIFLLHILGQQFVISSTTQILVL